MTNVAAMWMLMVLVMGAFTYMVARYNGAPTWSILSLPFLAVYAAFLIFGAAGYSTPCIRGWTAPDGDYTVLGYNIVQDVKIDLLLDVPDGPRVCYIPFSVADAKDLQETEESQQKLIYGFGEGEEAEAGTARGGPQIPGLKQGPQSERPPKED